MFQSILIPLDGSPESEKALDYARRALDGEEGGRLVLLRVLEVPQVSAWTSIDMLEAHEEEQRIVTDYMERIRSARFPAGTKVETKIHPGPHAAQAIAETAEKEQVEAIIMTSHGRTGLGRFFLGSVTEKVLRTVSLPVLIVR